jgi:hypothetical protein
MIINLIVFQEARLIKIVVKKEIVVGRPVLQILKYRGVIILLIILITKLLMLPNREMK